MGQPDEAGRLIRAASPVDRLDATGHHARRWPTRGGGDAQMEGTRRGPVVVVGAGIVGCTIAVHLADRGIRPVVVDPDRPGYGASVSSFASLSAFGKDPVAHYELACAGMASWSRWAERLGSDVGLRRDGEVRWAGDPREGDDLTERVARARRSGYPIRLVGEAELRHL